MRILKHGNKNKYTTYKCFNCNCKFEASEKEIKTEKSESVCYGIKITIYKRYIKCPECGEKIYL